MKLFLAWSGTASHHVAKVLRGWLPDVIQSVEPFMSSEDIRTGTRWFNEIGTQLEKTDFAILCMTPTTVNSTWMHFEAGAASKNVTHGRVAALLLDVTPTNLEPPLSQFQHIASTEEGIRKLMLDINELSDAKKLDANRVERAVKNNWDRLRAGLEEARKALTEELKGHKAPQRTSAEVMKSMLEVQQGVLARLQSMEEQLANMPLQLSALSSVINPYLLVGNNAPGFTSPSGVRGTAPAAPVPGGGLASGALPRGGLLDFAGTQSSDAYYANTPLSLGRGAEAPQSPRTHATPVEKPKAGK